MSFQTMSGQSFTLASSISSTQTTILLTSFKVPVTGTNITMASMGTTIAYGTLAPGTSSAELISFTGVTQNSDGTATLTGVTRGLDKEYPYAEDSAFKQPHSGQTIFILSDAPQVFAQYPAKQNDETITGRFTFPQSGTASAARAGAVYASPAQDTEFATKKYVDDIAIAGSPLATISTAGIIALGSSAQIENGVILGASNAYIGITNEQYGARKIIGYNRTGGSPDAYTVSATTAMTGYATGQYIGFTASFTNQGNATLNVNGYGAKNLFLGSTGLFAGAIATDAYVGAFYDGTQFEIVEGSDLISASATANKVPLRRTTGDITVPTTPTASTDAASKAYVDSAGGGFLTSGAPNTTTTNTTATVLTYALDGGTLSTNKGVRIRATVQVDITTSNAAATYTVQYGGTTIGVFGYSGVSGTPTVTAYSTIDILLFGAGTTSSQASSVVNTTQIASGTGGATQGLSAQFYSASVDSTVSQNITISCTSGGSSVVGSFKNYFIEKIV